MTHENKRSLVSFNRVCIFLLILAGLWFDEEISKSDVILGIASAWWLWLPTFVRYEISLEHKIIRVKESIERLFCEQSSS